MALRNADTEPPGVGERAIESFGKSAVAVALEPIIAVKARTNLFDCGTHRLRELCESEVDGGDLCALDHGSIRLNRIGV